MQSKNGGHLLLQPGPQADDGRLVLQASKPSVESRMRLDRYHAFTVTNRLQVSSKDKVN
jgi:hypothetical protein